MKKPCIFKLLTKGRFPVINMQHVCFQNSIFNKICFPEKMEQDWSRVWRAEKARSRRGQVWAWEPGGPPVSTAPVPSSRRALGSRSYQCVKEVSMAFSKTPASEASAPSFLSLQQPGVCSATANRMMSAATDCVLTAAAATPRDTATLR